MTVSIPMWTLWCVVGFVVSVPLVYFIIIGLVKFNKNNTEVEDARTRQLLPGPWYELRKQVEALPYSSEQEKELIMSFNEQAKTNPVPKITHDGYNRLYKVFNSGCCKELKHHVIKHVFERKNNDC